MLVGGLSPEGVQAALHDLEQLGIASNDTTLTAFVHSGVQRASRERFTQAAALEEAVIGLMQESSGDMEVGESHPCTSGSSRNASRIRGVRMPCLNSCGESFVASPRMAGEREVALEASAFEALTGTRCVSLFCGIGRLWRRLRNCAAPPPKGCSTISSMPCRPTPAAQISSSKQRSANCKRR